MCGSGVRGRSLTSCPLQLPVSFFFFSVTRMALKRTLMGSWPRIRREESKSWSASSAFRDAPEPLAQRGAFEFKKK